jgi:hypothetical protein
MTEMRLIALRKGLNRPPGLSKPSTRMKRQKG